ncbi:hypothetical protein [Desulfospira joergensenii]|uniref:hypothetical protein n=1 Tax=Desulfospira joergensenii TaxID=53329 RepID=UPI0003B633F9|nr:hypothetical protein [Desulfospira joergensenii]
MPDKWGRVGYNDFMGIANVFGQINNLNKQNQYYNRQNQEQAKKDQTHKDAVTNYAILGKDPESQNLVGGPEAQVQARDWIDRGNKYMESISDAKERKQAKEISELYLSGQWENLSPEKKKKYSASAVAQGEIVAANYFKGQTDARKAIEETKEALAKEGYNNLLEYRKYISKALQSGDQAGAATLISDLSKKMNHPYQYEYDPQTGRLKEYYLHSGSGRHEPTGGNLSMEDAVNMIMNITPEQFKVAQYTHLESITGWNEEARKPSGSSDGGRGQYYTKGGKEYYIYPQKAIENGVQQHYVVMDDENNKTAYKSMAELQQAGFRYQDLKREKDKADIESTQALTANRKAEKAYHDKRTATLGQGKFTEWKLYDPKTGKEYTAKDKGQFDYYQKQGLVPIDTSQKTLTKAEVDQYERSSKAFFQDTRDLGMAMDEVSGNIRGTIKKDNWENIRKIAKHHGVSLKNRQGEPVDLNGWWPGGKADTMDVEVMPFGTSQYRDQASIDQKGAKYETSATGENAFSGPGGSGRGPAISQMTRDEIKNAYKFSSMGGSDEPGKTPVTWVQEKMGTAQPNNAGYEKIGEGPIEMTLRLTGIETDLTKQKAIAKNLRSRFPDATEEQIVVMIQQAAKPGL